VDVARWRRWPRSFSIAGENPLIAYLMEPFLLSLFALTASLVGGRNFYEALGQTTGIGLVRAAVFAWIVVRLSGWRRSRGVRIQTVTSHWSASTARNCATTSPSAGRRPHTAAA
jgi:hypothetical protein